MRDALAMSAPAHIEDHTSARFRSLIRDLTGINLVATKVSLIEQRLRRRVLAQGLPDTETYLRRLLDGSLGEGEVRTVVDLITTNTTSFFREPEHFTYLGGHILPDLLAASGVGRPRVKISSAASSEGAGRESGRPAAERPRKTGRRRAGTATAARPATRAGRRW